MFPIPWNFPFRKKNGDMSTIGAEIGGAGSELPPHGVGDAGKLLGVKANGKLEWSDTVNSEIQTLTNEVHGNWSEGGINLLPPILYNNAPSMTYVGVTLTIDDLKFKLTGTASGDGGRLNLRTDPFTLKAGIYTVSGVIGASTAVHKASDNTVIIMRVNPSEYATFTLESDTEVFVGINVSNGITYNETVGLQIEKGSTATSYQPYAMTNRELTENYNIKTAFVSVPATYHGGSVANINFEKRNGVVRAWWAGGTPTFPAQGTEYEIGDIPEGFIPSQAQTGYGIDMNSFTKGMYLQLRTNGKIYIFGYNTGTGGTVNALVSLVYFV